MGNFILKYKYLIALGIFIIHYIFKTYALGATGLWFDECYSVYVGGGSIDEILKSTQTTDPNPPLYLILLHYWMLVFGDSEFGVRLLSVVASCLSASALFLFCVRFLNWQTAIFASIMYFTSNDLYYYAQEARTFSVLILFVILSNYFYLSIYKNPKIWQPFLLGLCNAIIFYLHMIATFNMIAQVICLPFILIGLQQKGAIKDKANFNFFRLSISKKTLMYYLISFVVFALALLPWVSRLINIMHNEAKTWWVSLSEYYIFKYAIYELFNSKEIYQVYIISFVSMLILLLFLKKFRETGIQIKIFLFIIVSGPLLIYIMYLVGFFAPIFLKRYVLFTFIGFILVYAYTFSLIKVNFYIKLVLFIALGIFSFQKVVFPRASFFEYDKAMVFLKKMQKRDTFISTNQQDLFSYYYDKKIFHLRPDSVKRDALLTKGVYAFISPEWVTKEDLSKYKYIYYTNSFDMFDSGNYIGRILETKFVLTNEIRCFKGMVIRHYFNPMYNRDSKENNSELLLYNKKTFFLKASNNKYVCAGGARNDVIIANKDNADTLETFSMLLWKNSNIVIYSHSDKYFSTELNGKTEITANRTVIGKWEIFNIINLGDNFVAFKAVNGKYLSLDEKSLQVFANADSIKKNEKFKIINAN